MHSPAPRLGGRLDRDPYRLEVEDAFAAPTLDERLWLPWYLPQWSSRRASAARYEVGGGALRLRIDADQPAWNPDHDGEVRVSSLQTGCFAGQPGSRVGQHRFREALTVREAQANVALYTPRFGLIEARARASTDSDAMVALWMIGYEDEPRRSGEICVFEIFGRDVRMGSAEVGMGVHPFHDPGLRDDFSREPLAIDVREAHDYAAEWTPGHVAFYVDERCVKVVDQSPAYPMQVMLGIYDFREPGRPVDPTRYPKVFTVERVRGWRPAADPGRQPARASR